MARNVTFKVLRGIAANMPTLQIGELYLATDTNLLYIGTSLGNTLFTPAVYNTAGTRQFPHIVTGSVTTTSKTVASTVTFSGAAAFTSASSYTVLIQSNAGHVTLTQISGTQFSVLTGAIGDVINFMCIGT